MRLKISESKNSKSLYVIKSYRNKGKNTSKIIEKLGTYDELLEKLDGKDPIEWAKQYIEELNQKEQEEKRQIMVQYSPSKTITKDEQRTFNGGYLFLQKIYYELKLNKLFKDLSLKHNCDFDLDSFLSRLLYSKILFPSSKLTTYPFSSKFIEHSNDKHQLDQALEIISKENELIQKALYNNFLNVYERNTSVLYYDDSNNLNLFMDIDGIPLSFSLNNGNKLKPLEKKIVADFDHSMFVVFNRVPKIKEFDDKKCSVIMTESIKDLKDYLKEWALNPNGWHLPNDMKTYSITKLDDEKDKNKIFYKERWIKENKTEQRLIVTYSIKYRDYPNQFHNTPLQYDQNDPNHLIDDEKIILQEQMEETVGGFYAVWTKLEDDVSHLIKINDSRLEIKEGLNIIKEEIKHRPGILNHEQQINAHLTIHILTQIFYRILEKKLGKRYSYNEIIKEIRDMDLYEIKGEGYIPIYTRTDLTDDLHKSFGFRTDYQIINTQNMRKIIKSTKV